MVLNTTTESKVGLNKRFQYLTKNSLSSLRLAVDEQDEGDVVDVDEEGGEGHIGYVTIVRLGQHYARIISYCISETVLVL